MKLIDNWSLLFGFCGCALLLPGCHAPLAVQTAVGPEPAGHEARGPNGRLLVFSRLEAHNDNGSMTAEDLTGEILTGDPDYYQHTAYVIYNQLGKRIRRIGNTVGHYSEAPREVELTPGNYFVQAEAECYGRVAIPVQIKSGRTTILHLDKRWRPPLSYKEGDLVRLPGGYAVGWSTGLSGQSGGSKQ